MRTLMQKRFPELQALFDRNKSDLAVLLSLRDELNHRDSPLAKQLRSQVELRIKLLHSTTGSKPPASAPVVTPTAPAVEGGPGSSGGDTALSRLRSTFTEEGELLARWGMTPSLPRHLQQLLIAAWREELRKSPTADGKSTTELEADLKRVAALRNAGA